MTNADDPNLNPFAATKTPEAANPVALQKSYGGIGRLAYVGLIVLVVIAGIVVDLVLNLIGPEATVLLSIPVALIDFGAILWITAQRITNTGYSRWWCVVISVIPLSIIVMQLSNLFIPFAILILPLHVILFLRCIACPEGYADHRKLDTAGKIAIGLFFLSIALFLILFLESKGFFQSSNELIPRYKAVVNTNGAGGSVTSFDTWTGEFKTVLKPMVKS